MNESEKTKEFDEKYDRLIAKIKEKGNELYRLETSPQDMPFHVRARESIDDLELYLATKQTREKGYLQKSRLLEYALHGIDRGIDKNKHKDYLSYYRGVLKALDLSFPIPEHTGVPEHGDEKERVTVTVTIDDKEYTLVVDEDSGDTEYKLKDDKTSSANPRKINQAKKAENNKKTGDIGEKLALAHERQRVPDTYKVEHSSVDRGDGLGYDIRSFIDKGEERYIEVKATEGAFNTPFFVTARELEECKKHPDEYYLYRVYNLNKGSARLRVIPGKKLIELCACARPAIYEVRIA